MANRLKAMEGRLMRDAEVYFNTLGRYVPASGYETTAGAVVLNVSSGGATTDPRVLNAYFAGSSFSSVAGKRNSHNVRVLTAECDPTASELIEGAYRASNYESIRVPGGLGEAIGMLGDERRACGKEYAFDVIAVSRLIGCGHEKGFEPLLQEAVEAHERGGLLIATLSDLGRLERMRRRFHGDYAFKVDEANEEDACASLGLRHSYVLAGIKRDRPVLPDSRGTQAAGH